MLGTLTHLCCGRCVKYLGGGDWGTSCKDTHDLVYEFSMPCAKFSQRKECINVSSRVGWFRCSRCGHFCEEHQVDGKCPNCGEEIVGSLFGSSKKGTEK